MVKSGRKKPIIREKEENFLIWNLGGVPLLKEGTETYVGIFHNLKGILIVGSFINIPNDSDIKINVFNFI